MYNIIIMILQNTYLKNNNEACTIGSAFKGQWNSPEKKNTQTYLHFIFWSIIHVAFVSQPNLAVTHLTFRPPSESEILDIQVYTNDAVWQPRSQLPHVAVLHGTRGLSLVQSCLCVSNSGDLTASPTPLFCFFLSVPSFLKPTAVLWSSEQSYSVSSDHILYQIMIIFKDLGNSLLGFISYVWMSEHNYWKRIHFFILCIREERFLKWLS